MKSYLQLVPKEMKERKSRTFFLLMGIMISMATLTGLAYIQSSFLKSGYEMALSGGEVFVSYPEGVANYENLKKHVKVEAVAEVNRGGEYQIDRGSYTLLKVNEEYYSVFHRALKEGHYPQKEGEVALSTRELITLGKKVGDSIQGLDDDGKSHDFRIVGSLLGGAAWMREFYTVGSHDGMLYVNMKPEGRSTAEIRSMEADLGIEPGHLNTGLLKYYENSYFGKNDLFATFALGLLQSLVMVATVFIITNGFALSFMDRIHNYGLLKTLGAGRGELLKMMFSEGFLLLGLGIPMGILAGTGAMALVFHRVNEVLRAMVSENRFYFVLDWQAILWAVLLLVVTVFVAILLAGLMVLRISPIDAMNRNLIPEMGKVRVKKHRLLKKLFGYEVFLARRNLERARGRFIFLVASMAVSIAIFVLGSYFINLIEADSRFENRGEEHFVLHYEGEKDKGADFLTKNGIAKANLVHQKKVFLKDRMIWVAEATEQEKKEYQIRENVLYQWDSPLMEEEPPQTSAEDSLVAETEEGKKVSLPIRAVEKRERMPEQSFERLYLSREDFFRLFPEEKYDLTLRLTLSSPSLERIKEEALYLKERFPNAEIENIFELVNREKQIAGIIKTFVYGYVSLLALISSVNVITTVGGTILQRKRELGMLRAQGMTAFQMAKMLLSEILLSSVLGFVIGSGVGIFLSDMLLGKAMTLGVLQLSQAIRPVLFNIGFAFLGLILLILLSAWVPLRRLNRETLPDMLME